MRNLPKSFEINLPGCFIAGGAILSAATRTDINDYDVYPKSNAAMIDAFHHLIDDGCFVVNVSDRAVTFKSNTVNNDNLRTIVQVMTYDSFETVEKIFENFDFTVCMGAFDCDAKTYVFHEDFYPDIATRTLRFNPKTRYPLNSMLRVNKYIAKGFFISKPELIKILLATISKGMPESWEELESQIGGTYGREVRLNKGDIPFSLEAALDLLSNIREFTEMAPEPADGRNDFSSYSAEDLEDMFSDQPKHVVVNSEGDYFTIDIETAIPKRCLGFVRPKNAIVVNESDHMKENLRLVGYKILRDLGNGKYGPGVQTYSKVIYEIGKETVEQSKPYLFVFPTQSNGMYLRGSNTKMFHVTYNPIDLRKVSESEIQVTKMKVGMPVEKGEEIVCTPTNLLSFIEMNTLD